MDIVKKNLISIICGVVAILGSGRGSDVEFQRVLQAMRPAIFNLLNARYP